MAEVGLKATAGKLNENEPAMWKRSRAEPERNDSSGQARLTTTASAGNSEQSARQAGSTSLAQAGLRRGSSTSLAVASVSACEGSAVSPKLMAQEESSRREALTQRDFHGDTGEKPTTVPQETHRTSSEERPVEATRVRVDISGCKDNELASVDEQGGQITDDDEWVALLALFSSNLFFATEGPGRARDEDEEDQLEEDDGHERDSRNRCRAN